MELTVEVSMKRSAARLQFLAGAAVATDTAIMSSRPSYRGGRKQWRRDFSDRPYNGGRGQQFVTGDSHFQSVQNANLGIRQAGGRDFNPRPQSYNQNQQFPRPLRYNPNQQFRQPPPFIQNQNHNHQFRQAQRNAQAFRPSQQLQPRTAKPLDYRDWEYAKTSLPPYSEKFVVLSYNILADYLAIDHRHKLYFHIPRYVLDWEWRRRKILFELGLWSADIMCFQEVEKFQDLEEELRLRGYCGIWKMRTGKALDGCAIFWRTSRFKLLYEESIEFNKIGLRDNVAQICVLELMSKNFTANASAPSTSSAGSDKVVICNIHVLYNPRRGEIKLGQVRTLLERAYAVSKLWNAPVVLCGDFNCTPKSPLYNFISGQKLDLSGIDRDKVSGQASAEIRSQRPFNPNNNPNPNLRDHSFDNLLQSPLVMDDKLRDLVPDIEKHSNSGKVEDNIPSSNDHCQSQYTGSVLDVSDMAGTAMLPGSMNSSMCAEEMKETEKDVIDNCKEGMKSTVSALIDNFDKYLTISHNEGELPVRQQNEQIHESTAAVTSHSEDTCSNENELEQTNSSLSNEGFTTERSYSNIVENKGTNSGNLVQTLEGSAVETSGYMSAQPIVNDENNDFSAPCQVDVSSMFTSNYKGDKKLEESSAGEQNDFQLEGGIIGEDENEFLSALHDTEDFLRPEFGQTEQPDSVHFQNKFASDPNDSEFHSPSNEVLNDISLDLDSEAARADKTMYNPALWTPMEIATATGNVECNSLEHPLKLKSTYTEVEDCSGTRDPNGEPLVTSYNRCFIGTVDYIWCSEGLQTVRALAPIPKHAMQWTLGFPTKKWGSDHIALASELAFTKGTTENMES